MEPIHPYMGANVRWYRKSRGLDVKHLAKLANISKSLIYQVERGEQHLGYANACAVAAALRVPVSVIWDHNPPPATPPYQRLH